MSNYIKYSRDLHNDPVFKSLSYEYRHIFLTILVHAAYKPTQMNDHGHLIEVKPGQLLTTQRNLIRLCDEEGIDRGKIRRALELFKNLKISAQETAHTKTLITITHPACYFNEENENGPRIDQRSAQDRPKIGPEKKKEKKERNKENKSYVGTADAIRLADLFLFSIKKIKQDFKEPSDLTKWQRELDRMIALDQRDIAQIESIIQWLPSNDFWAKNVLSAQKLRQQFDRLQLQKIEDQKRQESNAKLDSLKRNKELFYKVKNQLFKESKEFIIKGDYAYINSHKELNLNMLPDAFEKAFLTACGVKRN